MIRIKELRKQKKITAKRLAEYLNVAESTMSLYENGKREPDYNTLIRIAEYLGVSLDYLLGRTEDLDGVAEPTEKTDSSARITSKEAALLDAYRAQPDMQLPVEKLLGLTEDGNVRLYTAASSTDNRRDAFITISKEQWEKLTNAPDTDDSLI